MSALKTYRVCFQETTGYALEVTAESERAAIFAAADKFYGLSLADQADAVIVDGTLDRFVVKEVQP